MSDTTTIDNSENIERASLSDGALVVIKTAFADWLSEGLRSAYAEKLAGSELCDTAQIHDSIERPRKAEFGDMALPLFPYVKALKEAPPKVYAAICAAATIDERWGVVSFAGGYVNLTCNVETLANLTLTEVSKASGRYGSSSIGRNQRILVEFSSPNIAKPFGIGHLRSTVIGACLHRVYKMLGYDSLSINYLGDWGTQFGKMISAYKMWDGEKELKRDAVRGALGLYVRFHEEETNNSDLTEQARAEFKKLEDGDSDSLALWKMFKDVSLREFDRVYKTLGIEFDLITGESALNELMTPAIARLEKANLTCESRGALIVDLEEYDLPPCLLRKQDGATLYATRDIAGLLYRWEKYPFVESLYVVGAAQADHFKQVYKVVELLEDAEGVSADERMSNRLRHVPFGWVKFQDKALSTRSGNVIFLDDVLTKAIDLANEKIRSKNPDLPNAAEIARQIGVGAIVFTQLSVRKQKDVNFSWEEALSFEGETGPYLQYTHARLSSLLRKYGKDLPAVENLDSTAFEGTVTRQLLLTIARFPEIVRSAGAEYEPFLITGYLLELASQFNSFYQQKDSAGKLVRIISDVQSETEAKLSVVTATREVIRNGLNLLGLDAPEEM
ncbi:arginine--tRNA ligase [Gemmatimonas aurantiaca]|nr:arginine--tRNA ligase [Gemmatimonas aurantiaca]